MTHHIAVDTGGTFTDIIAIDGESGVQYAIKTPSTPDDPSRAVLEGINKVMAVSGASLSEVSRVLHGTTVATNAVLEHQFQGLGLIVTEGFRHIIEIARQSVPDGYGNSYFWVKPPRLVPLHLVREVKERISFDGSILQPLEEASVVTAVDDLVKAGADRIAVCLLHCYANSAHEQQIGEVIQDKFPEIFVSLSSVVLPEYREYERAMTTLIDVMVKPYCKTYLQQARGLIQEKSDQANFLIMQSNGGIVTSQIAGEKPVTMLMSGPAGGVLGAMYMADMAGYKDLLTLDVGGTSTDVSLIQNLKPELTSHSLIEGYPVKTPMLDIVTVGTGGGSLAWVNRYGALKVGPRSAGAAPGPICYGLGGTEPTVTDAAVVLGLLPDRLIGGGLILNIASSRAAYEKLGERLAIGLEEAAAGVLQIAAANCVNGIRQVTTIKGRDPSRYAMVAFGGAGGLFAAEVADFLGIQSVISPPNPGNLSAFGLHVSDIKSDYVKTLVRQQSNVDLDELQQAWIELEQRGVDELTNQGVLAEQIVLSRSADMRYVGEGNEVNVNLPTVSEERDFFSKMWSEFHQVHDRTFGFHYENQQDVEIVNIRVHAVGRVHRPEIKALPHGSGAQAEPAGSRQVYWRGKGWLDCDIYVRTEMQPAQCLQGPVIIEEYGSTIVIPTTWSSRVDAYGNLVLEIEK
ncbi:MAG: hydantoinase/oxoprolinase family protein [Arenicellales bacterium]|jgi:N-methylhydantoinase A|nr:hydantoinase/oxoprolinase family protein [Arenicellales bacterium]|tara:strand:+ start:272 stop:2326 length:2055 start_codon:yes stop_codon:yes gene_type:complete